MKDAPKVAVSTKPGHSGFLFTAVSSANFRARGVEHIRYIKKYLLLRGEERNYKIEISC
jgi:hypothetical protein